MRGRTLWQILTAPKPTVVPVEQTIYNPFKAKVGDHVRIDHIDYNSHIWTIEGILAWDRLINNTHHPMADYLLVADENTPEEKSLTIRVFPQSNDDHTILILSQYYPETDAPLYWCEESPHIITALEHETFIRHAGAENEEKYWRIGGKIPIICEVTCLMDRNSDDVIDSSDLRKEPFTLWDFHRNTVDEAGNEITQYLYGQLHGKFKGFKNHKPQIVDGEQWLVLLRGFPYSPERISVYN